jgi:tRNA1Val (adenine37-N6)-methyltransferase
VQKHESGYQQRPVALRITSQEFIGFPMAPDSDIETLTEDTFFEGRLRVAQSRIGYRFSIDAVLLAHFFQPRAGQTLVDLGTGCGIIPLMLVFRHPRIRAWGIEIQPELAGLAADNVRANHMADRIRILQADIRAITPDMTAGPVDVVCSNPPYRRGRSGRLNPDGQRAVARHEIAITLPGLLHTSRRLLKTGGRFVTIHPAERAAELIGQMRSMHLEPKRLRPVHSTAQTDARRVLVEGLAGGRPGLTIAAPLIVYGQDGEYSSEVQRMLLP